MKDQKSNSKEEKGTNQIIQRKGGKSFVKPRGAQDSFTPPKSSGKQNKSLPDKLQSNMENSFGQDFSNVGVHTNSQKAVQMNARAYTQAEQIHFAPGEFNPSSTSGQNLIGHEFTHVAQQRAGVVKPTKVLQKGVAINDNKGLESEADSFGQKAAKGETVSKYRGVKASSSVTMQGKKNDHNLSENLTNAFSTVQQQGAVAQFTLSTDIDASLNITGPPYFEGVIATIRAASVTERQAVLADAAVMTLIRSSFPADLVARLISELMVGSQEWDNPRDSDFYIYFVVNRGSGELPTTDTMNCWESIMYAAYLAGQINSDWIYNFYNRAGVVIGTALASPNPTPQVWAELGWTAALPVVIASGVVNEGDLVFYTSPGASFPGHVAVYVGNEQVISLWDEPNGITSIQLISINSFPGKDIQYGPKPW
jgi:hypothetical protein